jgi:hypothetical protein
MKLRAALGVVLVVVCTACGSTRPAAVTTTTTRTKTATTAVRFHVGVVGNVDVVAQNVVVDRGTLARVDGNPLVFVDAGALDLATVVADAHAHPRTHYAWVGGSIAGNHVSNLVGLVLRDDEAAELGGLVAGLVAAANGNQSPRVAWVGPEERKLAAAFGRGVHKAVTAAVVLHQWSRSEPAHCKEAALTAISRGAVAIMAHGGACANAAAAAAHQQNVPAIRVSDFELPAVAAGLIVRDAQEGLYHGNEDIAFGAPSGAIAVGPLDPLIPLATVVRARAAAQALANGTHS